MLSQSFGWSYAIGALCIVGLVGMFVFILIWNVKVDGYEE
jgi:hypothetical protein